MRACAVLLVSTLQGCAMAMAAGALGDAGPRHDGRLGIDPLRHLDPIGGAIALIFSIGWGRWGAITSECSEPRFTRVRSFLLAPALSRDRSNLRDWNGPGPRPGQVWNRRRYVPAPPRPRYLARMAAICPSRASRSSPPVSARLRVRSPFHSPNATG